MSTQLSGRALDIGFLFEETGYANVPQAHSCICPAIIEGVLVVMRRHTLCEKVLELIKVYREEKMKTKILFSGILAALLCIPTLGSANGPLQEIIATDTQYFHVTAGKMICTFAQDGNLLRMP